VKHWIANHYHDVQPGQYILAVALESGEWDKLDVFDADGPDDALRIAEADYPHLEWYVLNHNGDVLN
jgi:hypothetical protein